LEFGSFLTTETEFVLLHWGTKTMTTQPWVTAEQVAQHLGIVIDVHNFV
jgi:hypothetical protein